MKVQERGNSRLEVTKLGLTFTLIDVLIWSEFPNSGVSIFKTWRHSLGCRKQAEGLVDTPSKDAQYACISSFIVAQRSGEETQRYI